MISYSTDNTYRGYMDAVSTVAQAFEAICHVLYLFGGERKTVEEMNSDEIVGLIQRRYRVDSEFSFDTIRNMIAFLRWKEVSEVQDLGCCFNLQIEPFLEQQLLQSVLPSGETYKEGYRMVYHKLLEANEAIGSNYGSQSKLIIERFIIQKIFG